MTRKLHQQPRAEAEDIEPPQLLRHSEANPQMLERMFFSPLSLDRINWLSVGPVLRQAG